MNIETMRLLVEKGLSAADILEVAETMAAPVKRSAAAERQARYRARLKGDDVTRDVTRYDNAECDPAPSPLSPPYPPITPHPHPDVKTPRARKGRIPEGWLPGELPPNVKTLADLWPPGRIERELDGFRDFWLTKPRDYHRENWDRVWWNRIRDIHDRVMRDNRNDRKPSDDDQIRNPYARVAARQAASAGQSSG